MRWSTTTLLVGAQATVSPDRLSSKVIGRERTRVPQHHELALWLCLYLHSVYVLCTCVLFVCGKKTKISSVDQKGEKSPDVGRENASLECRPRERSPRVWAKPPSVGREAKPPSVGRSPRAWVERPSPRAWAKPPSVGRKAEPPSMGEAPERGSKGRAPEHGRTAKPPSVGRRAEPPSMGEAPECGHTQVSIHGTRNFIA
jgi:hypothetical protein